MNFIKARRTFPFLFTGAEVELGCFLVRSVAVDPIEDAEVQVPTEALLLPSIGRRGLANACAKKRLLLSREVIMWFDMLFQMFCYFVSKLLFLQFDDVNFMRLPCV
jgi:hypothetical protein